MLAEAAGLVTAVHVHSGERVAAGQTLIALDITASRAALEESEKRLQFADSRAAQARARLDALAADRRAMLQRRAQLLEERIASHAKSVQRYEQRARDFEALRERGFVSLHARDDAAEDPAGWRCVTTRPPTEEERRALAFAWAVCRHVKSNAIVIAGAEQTVGIGAGQMSRVDSCRLAIDKARLPVAGTSAASDAFFPFRDGLDVLAEAGVTAVVQPGGSKRDSEVIAAADEHGIAMLFTGVRHFRH